MNIAVLIIVGVLVYLGLNVLDMLPGWLLFALCGLVLVFGAKK